MGTNFSAGSGFQAVIAPSTCVTDCEDCCVDWAGFTIDEIPNPPIISTIDNDPTNDIWQVTDINHPFCAYGAQGFELTVSLVTGSTIYDISSLNNDCCTFKSVAPENPIGVSSIWWNGAIGYSGNGTPIQEIDAFYYYVLTLYGCDGQILIKDGYVAVNPTQLGGRVMNSNKEMTEDQKNEIQAILDERTTLESKIEIYPNPTSANITIKGIEQGQFSGIQFYNEQGQILNEKEPLNENNVYSVEGFSSGTYYVRIYTQSNNYVLKKFVKQ